MGLIFLGLIKGKMTYQSFSHNPLPGKSQRAKEAEAMKMNVRYKICAYGAEAVLKTDGLKSVRLK